MIIQGLFEFISSLTSLRCLQLSKVKKSKITLRLNRSIRLGSKKLDHLKDET